MTGSNRTVNVISDYKKSHISTIDARKKLLHVDVSVKQASINLPSDFRLFNCSYWEPSQLLLPIDQGSCNIDVFWLEVLFFYMSVVTLGRGFLMLEVTLSHKLIKKIYISIS